MGSTKSANSTSGIPGVDLDGRLVDHFLKANIPGLRGRLRMLRAQGGQSNPTYILAYDNRKLVLRRRPDGVLLPSAHAVGREYRVQQALWSTGVAVPRVILHCTDPAIARTEFYIMDHVEGRTFQQDSLPGVDRAQVRPMLLNLARMLARIHSVDIDAAGLRAFGRQKDYFARQINLWSRQWKLSKGRDLQDMNRLPDWLLDNLPQETATTIVHGDYRSGNVIFHPTGSSIRAVLDWELSTLGHPFADLAHVCAYIWVMSDIQADIQRAPRSSASICGLTMSEFADAYFKEAATDLRLSKFHMAFALFRNAAIYEGVLDRARRGNAAATDAARLGNAVPVLARRAVELTVAGEDFMDVAQSLANRG